MSRRTGTERVKPEEHRCPTCGAAAKLRYRTVLVEGVRIPVEPYLACDLGHEHDVPTPGQEPTSPQTVRPVDDTELIG